MIETVAWILFGAALLPAHRAAAREGRSVVIALLVLEAIALALMLIAAVSTEAWISIAQEDGAIEWATFAAFVLAAGWFVVSVRRAAPSWLFTAACCVIAVFCGVVALEEISWGQRLVGFKPPEMFLERNYQQELNLHNVLMHEGGLGFALESKHLVIAIVLGFGLVLPALVRTRRLAPFAPLAPPIAFAPIVLAVIAIQLSYPVELTGEGAELMVGLLFVASALVRSRASERTQVAWLVSPLVLGLVIATVLSRLVFGSDRDGQRVAHDELLQLRADVLAGRTEQLARKNIHKRLFAATRAGYLALAGRSFLEGAGTPAEPGSAAPRTDRRGYFLDPWNNPYWISYDQRARTGAIYSFGPNRRRDLDPRDHRFDPGDDVVVRFRVPAIP